MVVALLPARNAARHLDRYLACVETLGASIVALDDGSTDDTADRLHASPLVRTLLRNPVRTTYAGWDDATNRQRLLTAAESLRPTWILQLDADEEISGTDARLLLELVRSPAPRHTAYSFQVFRMLDGDGLTYDKANLWVYRLFRYAPGMRLPSTRLHLEPVPVCIPAHRRLRTHIRIRHFSSVTTADREARFAKYREADANNEFQASYQNLLSAPGNVRPWLDHPDDVQPVIEPQRHATLLRKTHLCPSCIGQRLRRFVTLH
ncbi:glycosyltransferase family 2 protein [Rariglobus hedericola]|uniref:Glycosyltransferase family 2 protein n=1 Tax=Rariglobus hedericola TaxID=2597822 RepID=A0A556QK73_9BACT|nr:glycosyltransferase family 2 protein [Rariglobus hedericola]TSJ77012.1 hypothetical protein FPL22_12950 [Rariglobus hedericola]